MNLSLDLISVRWQVAMSEPMLVDQKLLGGGGKMVFGGRTTGWLDRCGEIPQITGPKVNGEVDSW